MKPAGAASTLAQGCSSASRLPTTRNGSCAKNARCCSGMKSRMTRGRRLHLLARTGQRLQRALARMERRGDHAAGAAALAGVRTIGTNPGRASTRASQPRTCG
jgi:hypothetical protein